MNTISPAMSSTAPEDPAQLLLIWHINHVSYLHEARQNLITSPAFTTPTGDATWRVELKPKGLRHGTPICQIRYESGDPRVIAKGQVRLLTPRFIWTRNFNGRIVEGGGVTCNRYDSRLRQGGGRDEDRVTIQVRLWMDVPRPPVHLQAISTLRLTPLIFTASCQRLGLQRRIVLDEPVTSYLKSGVSLNVWTPDGRNWGLIVHLGDLFKNVLSLKATFVLSRQSPTDPKSVILTDVRRTVMFHRWNGGTSFRVAPFFSGGPACIFCDFRSFSGERDDHVRELRHESDDRMAFALAPTKDEDVTFVLDVEQEEETTPKRSSRSVLRSLFRRFRPAVGCRYRL